MADFVWRHAYFLDGKKWPEPFQTHSFFSDHYIHNFLVQFKSDNEKPVPIGGALPVWIYLI